MEKNTEKEGPTLGEAFGLLILGLALRFLALVMASVIVLSQVNQIIANGGAEFWNIFWILLVGWLLFDNPIRRALDRIKK